MLSKHPRKARGGGSLFTAWVTAPDLDAGPTILAIIKALGDYDDAGIGASQNFLADGRFTGPSFSITDAQAFHRSRQDGHGRG
jgi:hypothetical protein